MDARGGRREKNLLAAFFTIVIGKTYNKSKKKGIYKRRIFCYDRLRYKTYQISIERKITK